jgi:hypothetical protein
MLFILSGWRYVKELFKGKFFPRECRFCDAELNSHHILFECISTDSAREEFERLTSSPFDLAALEIVTKREEILKVFRFCFDSISCFES